MLSKFQTKNKTETKKFSRKTIANLLMKEEKKELFPSIGSSKAENFPKDRREKVKWQMNPLYKAKSSNIEESESESMISLSSQQSYLHSERSVDSGYKSNIEEGNDLQKILDKVNFRKIATEILDTMKALGARADDNAAMRKALEDCEYEIEKLNIEKL
ncbi:Pesticidal crystal protein Cry1Cb [Dirofilaria immitis]